MNHAPHTFFNVGNAAAVEVSAGTHGFQEQRADPFEFGGLGELLVFFLDCRRSCFCVANYFVESDRDCLSQIHRDIAFDGGDAHQPVAMAERVVGEAKLFRPKEERDAG